MSDYGFELATGIFDLTRVFVFDYLLKVLFVDELGELFDELPVAFGLVDIHSEVLGFMSAAGTFVLEDVTLVHCLAFSLASE